MTRVSPQVLVGSGAPGLRAPCPVGVATGIAPEGVAGPAPWTSPPVACSPVQVREPTFSSLPQSSVNPSLSLQELLSWRSRAAPQPPWLQLELMPPPWVGGLWGRIERAQPELSTCVPQGQCLACVPRASGGWTVPRGLRPVQSLAPREGLTSPATLAATALPGCSCW